MIGTEHLKQLLVDPQASAHQLICLTFVSAALSSPKSHNQVNQTASKGTSAKGTGMDEGQLPARFRRRPIDQVEIDYITVSKHNRYLIV